MNQETYKISLPQFEGPFDLLLFFIERDELDIYDIPIAKITNDFLDYIHQMETLNIELASEFILVAATLMRIKAKTLLPRKEMDEEGNEIDPREELVQRLIEYKRYKEVTATLRDMESARIQQNKRGNIQKELNKIADMYSTESELESLTLYKLMTAFQRVIEKMETRENKVIHQVVKYNYTIKSQKDYLINKVKTFKQETPFETIFEEAENRVHAVFTFLAMLELIQEQILKLKLGNGTNNFWITYGLM